MAVTAGWAVVLKASGVLSPEELLQLFAPVDLSCFFWVAFEVLLVLTDDVTKTSCAIAVAAEENFQDELGFIFAEG